MKIVDVKATAVTVHLDAPLRRSIGIETGTTCSVIELFRDQGLVGLGETYGGNSTVAWIEECRALFIGMDPFEVQVIGKKFDCFRVTSEQTARSAKMRYVAAGIEITCWDIIGKALDKPLYELRGGAWAGQTRCIVSGPANRLRPGDGPAGSHLLTKGNKEVERPGMRRMG